VVEHIKFFEYVGGKEGDGGGGLTGRLESTAASQRSWRTISLVA
jgi:hypothetical protein